MASGELGWQSGLDEKDLQELLQVKDALSVRLIQRTKNINSLKIIRILLFLGPIEGPANLKQESGHLHDVKAALNPTLIRHVEGRTMSQSELMILSWYRRSAACTAIRKGVSPAAFGTNMSLRAWEWSEDESEIGMKGFLRIYF